MPHDPILINQHLIEDAEHDIVVLEKHEAPANGNADFYYDFDKWRAARVMAVLQETYKGHLWHVTSDAVQGIVKINIPILMGINNYYVINQYETDITPGAIIVAGGEILERYGLLRGKFHLPSFLEAREKHSALVIPSRKVPE